MDKDKIQRMTTNKGIKWKFNPPGGSHFGGVHEIMFEAAKKAIYAVLRSSNITDEELTTPNIFCMDKCEDSLHRRVLVL